jgi:hypothetical protein
MREIDKLRQRMKNIPKNIVEYRMTIPEANAILAEFEEMQRKLEEKPQPVSDPVSFDEEPKGPITWDGGSF